MENSSTYILWLPSWYPDKIQPLNGDFVQRHARAASLCKKIEVIHVVKDEKGLVTRGVHREVKQEGNLRENFIYYYFPKRFPGFLNRFLSHRKYLSLYRAAISERIRENGAPAMVHIYIALKAGLLAGWIKRKFGIDYVVSEQSTIYLDEARPGFNSLPAVFRSAAGNIFREAKAVMVVSEYLGKALQQKFGIAKPKLIPNVVNEEIFSFQPRQPSAVKTFVHISTLNYQKNAEDMILAFQLVKNKGQNFRLHIIGPAVAPLLKLVKELGLSEQISFHHEMPQQQLVKLVQQSDAMVLFSRYETFGCVVIEALACGLPVILSNIPVFHENAGDKNALFAKNESSEDLAEKIMHFMLHADNYDREMISRQTIERYNFNTVGRQLAGWYEDVAKR